MGNKIIRIAASGAPGLPGAIQTIVAGANVTVDNTDPANPVVASTGGGGDSVAYKEDWTPVLGVGPLIFTQAFDGGSVSIDGLTFQSSAGGGSAGYSGAVVFQDVTKRGVRFSLNKAQITDGQPIYVGFLNGIIGVDATAGLIVALVGDTVGDNILVGGIGNPLAGDMDGPVNTHTYTSGEQIMVSIDDTGLVECRIGGVVYGYIPTTGGIVTDCDRLAVFFPTPGGFVDVAINTDATIYPTITDYTAPSLIADNYPADRAKQGYKITGVGSMVLTIGTVTDGDIVYFDDTDPEPVLIGRTVADDGTESFLTTTLATALFQPKIFNNYNFSGIPGANDDIFSNYSVGSTILQTDVSPNEFWVCSDNTATAAVWLKTTLTIDELAQLLTDISNAQSDATQALADAATAQSAADDAQTDATQALTDAGTAQTTANGAASDASDALLAAEQTSDRIFWTAINGDADLTAFPNIRHAVLYNSAAGDSDILLDSAMLSGGDFSFVVGKLFAGNIVLSTNGNGNFFKADLTFGGLIDTGSSSFTINGAVGLGKSFFILKLWGVIPADEKVVIWEITGKQL